MEHDRTHFFYLVRYIYDADDEYLYNIISGDFFVKKNLKNVIKKEMVKSI